MISRALRASAPVEGCSLSQSESFRGKKFRKSQLRSKAKSKSTQTEEQIEFAMPVGVSTDYLYSSRQYSIRN
jgi:hypothetical protein